MFLLISIELCFLSVCPVLLKYLSDQVCTFCSQKYKVVSQAKPMPLSQVGIYRHLHQNMISHFNLAGISGDLNFSSLDREEIETFL